MGKKGGGSAPKADPRVGLAMEKQANVLERQQDWYENEIYPWLKEQTELQNQWSLEDRQQAKEYQDWYRGLAQEAYDKNNARSDEYHAHWQNDYLPIENALINDASRYNTNAEAERQAALAIGDYSQSFANQRQAQAMRMQAYGVNPTAGAYQAQDRALMTNQAALQAQAANQARNAAEQLGWTKRMQLADLGLNYVGAAQNAINAGTSSASQTGSLANQSGGQANTYGQQGLGNIASTANVGLNSYSALANGWGNYGQQALNLSNYNLNAWKAKNQLESQNGSGFGRLIGQLGSAAATAYAGPAGGAALGKALGAAMKNSGS